MRATGRPILFSACEWGANKPWEWGRSAGCQMWRTTGDIEDSWESMEKLGFSQDGKQAYAGPDGWNDPDMLVVGMYGKGNVAKGGMSDTEYRVHFALWCMLAVAADDRLRRAQADAGRERDPDAQRADRDQPGSDGAAGLAGWDGRREVRHLDEADGGWFDRGGAVQPARELDAGYVGRVGVARPARSRDARWWTYGAARNWAYLRANLRLPGPATQLPDFTLYPQA